MRALCLPLALITVAACAPAGDRPAAGPVVAQPAAAPERTHCADMTAWMTDPAPAGRNVRAAPSADAPIIGVIPPPLRPDQVPAYDRGLPAEVTLIGSEGGWLHISSARFDPTLVEGPVPPAYAGEGWIWGRGITVALQTRAAFAAPSHDAPILIDARPDSALDGWQQAGLAGCDGQWVLVDWVEPPAPLRGQRPARWNGAAVVSRAPLTLRGWATGVCDILETTCDGLDGTSAATAFRD